MSHPAPRWALIASALLIVLALGAISARAQTQTAEQPIDPSPDILSPGEPSPQEEADGLAEEPGYGYAAVDGRLALATDTAAVFCPDSNAILLHPEHQKEAQAQLGATDLNDGTWAIPDPDTGDTVIAKTQLASYNFDAGGNDSDELLTLATLPVVSRTQVALIPWFWPRCWRLRIHYQCGVIGNCPLQGLCFGGYQITKRRRFLRCAFSPWSFCFEFYYPVCTLTRYTCRDCTGPVRFRRPLNQWVCAVF